MIDANLPNDEKETYIVSKEDYDLLQEFKQHVEEDEKLMEQGKMPPIRVLYVPREKGH